jgi:hypothetical protein
LPNVRSEADATAQIVVLFTLAGLCEIGGGYLIWQWLRAGKSPWLALAGALMLVLYGIVPTFQMAHFGRVYALTAARLSRCHCCGAGRLTGLCQIGSTC